MTSYSNDNSTVLQGKQIMKQAKKLKDGGVFRKRNPDEAEKLYQKAKKIFRFMKPATFESLSLYLECLQSLSDVQEDMNLNNAAAKSMDEATRACMNHTLKDEKQIKTIKISCVKYHKKASYFYRLNKQYELACKNLKNAAYVMGNDLGDIEKAIELLSDMCAVQEDEQRYHMCHEFFDAAVKFTIVNKRLPVQIIHHHTFFYFVIVFSIHFNSLIDNY